MLELTWAEKVRICEKAKEIRNIRLKSDPTDCTPWWALIMLAENAEVVAAIRERGISGDSSAVRE